MSVLSPSQQRVLEQLLPIARIAVDGSRSGLPITPRTASMIIGPSGSGKSHVAAEIAKRLEIPCLHINVGCWVLMASRSKPWTWGVIAEWIADLQSGGILIVDEIDKISGQASHGGSSSEYGVYLRLEIHDLLDGRVPPSLTTKEESDDDFPLPSMKVFDRALIAKTLQEKVMILGCGAFQSAWLNNANKGRLGFAAGPTIFQATTPTREQLRESINPELRQRFRDELAVLPMMTAEDYMAVATDIAKQLPNSYRHEWRIQLEATIAQAIEGNLGMRAFEELLLKAMIRSKEHRGSETSLSRPSINDVRLS